MSELIDAAEPTRPAVDPSDEALLARIAARDRAAFEALFRRYAGRIRAVLIKAGAAADEAEEAMQEALLSVWRKADSYDPTRASAAAWIFSIARNRRIDMLRRLKRPEPDPDDPLFQPEAPAAPEDEVAAAIRDARIREAVSSLNEAQRDAVHLAFFIGLSHPEIAARTGAPLGTVKSRLRLASDRLRDALGPEFQQELFGD